MIGLVGGLAWEAKDQFAAGKFDGGALFRSGVKGALIGAAVGAGNIGAIELTTARGLVADGFTKFAGSITGAAIGGTIIPTAVDVLSGQKKPSEVNFAESLKQGGKEAVTTALGHMVSGSSEAIGSGVARITAITAGKPEAAAAESVFRASGRVAAPIAEGAAGRAMERGSCANGKAPPC